MKPSPIRPARDSVTIGTTMTVKARKARKNAIPRSRSSTQRDSFEGPIAMRLMAGNGRSWTCFIGRSRLQRHLREGELPASCIWNVEGDVSHPNSRAASDESRITDNFDTARRSLGCLHEAPLPENLSASRGVDPQLAVYQPSAFSPGRESINICENASHPDFALIMERIILGCGCHR